MSCQEAKGKPVSYQALLDKNRALQDEIENLRARLAESEELTRAISEGDLDALVIPGAEGELVFTLNSADQAYRVLVETMNEGTATIASDGTILYCNRRFAELLRMYPQAIVGTSIYRFIAPESASNFNAFLEHKKDMGEIKLRTEGGASLPVYLSISLMQASGSPNAWCLVVTDLTEQKKNEEIVAAERLARSIIEQAAEGIVVCDTSGKITHFSSAITKICECNPTFHRFEDLMDLRFSEGVDAGKSILPVSSALNGSSILGMEAIFERKDFRNFHLILNSGPLKNDNGEIIGCVVTITDITERKRAEEALRESEAQLQVVIAHSPDIIFEQDRDLRYKWIFNPASPYAVSDILGKTDAELLPPDQAQQLESIKRRVIDKGIREQAILQLAPGGEPRWYEAIYDPRFNEAGQVIGVLSYTRDITERKRAEEALRESEQHERERAEELATVMETTPVAIWIGHDPQSHSITGNRMANEFYEVKAGENVSANITPVRRFFHKGIELAADELPMQQASLNDIDVRNVELDVLLESGKWRFMLGSASPLHDADGHVRGSIGAFIDITERKRADEALRESEAKFRNLFENIEEMVTVYEVERDSGGRIVERRLREANPAFLRAVGVSSADEILGKTSGEVFGKVWSESHLTAVQKAMDTGEVQVQEFFRPESGRYYITSVVRLDAETYLGTSRDITNLKRAEEELREAEEIARQRLMEIEDLYHNAPVGLCELDRELRYVRINERLAEFNGIPAAAHIGKRVRDLMPQLADMVEPQMFRILETGQPRLDIEVFSETPAHPGVKRSWLEQWLPITDDKGRVTGLNIVVEETTERKRNEAMREAIVTINQIIHSTLDFDEIMKQTVSEASKVVGSDSAAISLRENGRWTSSYVHGLPADVIGMEMSDEEELHAVLAVKTRKPVAINDAFNDERVNRNHMKKWDIRSVLVVPLITRNRIIGALFFNYQKSTFEFDDVHVDFANQLASSISMALENSHLYENLKIELTERKQADEKLLKAYEQIKIQSEELQVFNEELQAQTEELRVTNEALQESEKRFRTLAENSPDIIARFDRQNRHTYVNPAAAKVYGLSQEEIIGKTYSELRRDPEQVRLLETYSEIVFATGKTETIDFQHTSPQGKEYYFNTKIVPEFANGKVNSILTISHDITNIKKAETKLKETLDNLDKLVKERTAELEQTYNTLKESERSLAEAQKIAHIGNWDHNLITGELHWSDETYRIFGLKPQESEITYNTFLGFIHPDDRDFAISAVKQALNKKFFDIEFRIISADGVERIVHENIEVVFDKENIPVRMRGTVQDITERKKAENVLAKIEIARKQEIHHRIKNNLQVISSLLDLQAEQFRDRENIIDSEVLKAFRESQNRVISMALIHEELYKGGGFETLNFSPYIEELTENLFLTYRLGNNISLKKDLAEHVFFDMDTAVPLGIIINELVSNSLKHAFIGRDKGEILIKLHREENAECINSIEGRRNEDCKSTCFSLTVSDNGVGIPENLEIEDLDTLGFQLVTTLVDQLDGELELKKNNGTEFTMRFTVTEKNNQV